jgi:hypothetical protein
VTAQSREEIMFERTNLPKKEKKETKPAEASGMVRNMPLVYFVVLLCIGVSMLFDH